MTPDRPLRRDEPARLAVLALGGGFVALGALFIAVPRAGAALFGLSPPEGEALLYLPAIGLRDVAFGLYLVGLALFSTRRATGIVLAVTVLIPLGDMALVAFGRGLSGYLVVHLISGLVVGGAGAWLLAGSGRSATDNSTGEDPA